MVSAGMSQQPAPNTFANVRWVPFLAAGGIVVGGVALLERFRPELALPAAVVVLLGVGLTWRDSSGTTAATRFGQVLQSSLTQLQTGAGLVSGSPPSGIGLTGGNTGTGGSPGTLSPPTISNPLPGLNLASIFPGGFNVTTPYRCGAAGSGCTYSFNGLTVHQGIDIIPRGLSAVQAIGHNVVNPIAGTFVAAIAGSPEQRGIVLRLANGLYEHLYHIDPSRFVPGQAVPAGATLGTIAAMAGAHVHYEIRSTPTIGGQSYNPLPYLGGQ